MSEAARADLYNGLAEVLGAERAETLMTNLPGYDPAEVATKTDLAELKTELRADIRDLKDELSGINRRMDRLFLTLLAGLFVIVAAMAGVIFTTL